jgi:HEAT repeat protein
MGSGEEHARHVEALERAGRERDHAAVPSLIDILLDEKQCFHTRGAAIRSLVQLDARESAPAILKLLARDTDPDTRGDCIDALVAFRFAQARRYLERLASTDDPLSSAARAALERL